MADILLESLAAQEASAHEAYQLGFRAATDRYRVVFRCPRCQKGFTVEGKESKAEAAKTMTDAGYGHKGCV